MKSKMLERTCEVVDLIKKSIHFVRTQNYYERSRVDEQVMIKLSDYLSVLTEDKGNLGEYDLEVLQQNILAVLHNLMGAYEKKDFILYGDLLELQMLPILAGLQDSYIQGNPLEPSDELFRENIKVFQKIDSRIARKLEEMRTPDFYLSQYGCEYTSSGYPTLYKNNNESSLYLHSNNDPRLEGFYWAEEHFGFECEEYQIFGLGLGYHIEALLEKSLFANITVYEQSMELIKIASYYRDYSFLLDNRVHLQISGEISPKNVVFNEKKRFLPYNPSVLALEDDELKQRLELFILQYQSSRGRLQLLNNNFRLNISGVTKVVDELEEEFRDKTVYIVAAGPSLDQDIRLLSKVSKEAVIFATGAVLKKLLLCNIIPDYCIITDPGEVVYLQTQGIENCNVPLLYMSTVYYKVPQTYCGEKYMILQQGYEKSETYAKENGYITIETGGSVSTTAIELCLKFVSRKVVCLGLDLAYPEGLDHAKDVPTRLDITGQDLIEVENNEGGTVRTSRTFEVYRRWIEAHIAKSPNIQFINVSKSGARIRGMDVQSLDCVIQEEKIIKG